MNDSGVGLVTSWCAWLRAGGTPSTTIKLRRHYLSRLAADVDLLAVDAQGLAEWLGARDWSANTRKSARSALRAFYAWCELAGHVESSPAAKLPAVRVQRARAKPAPETAYRAAMGSQDPRVALMVRLAGQCGLRRAEISTVRREDVEPDLVGWSLRVQGKGGHVRLVPLPDELARTLLRLPEGWVFPSPTRPGQPLTPGHVGKLLSLELPVGYSGHSLRHRCATTAYAATRDLLGVQELLGHAKPETTAGYVLPPPDGVRAAVHAAAA